MLLMRVVFASCPHTSLSLCCHMPSSTHPPTPKLKPNPWSNLQFDSDAVLSDPDLEEVLASAKRDRDGKKRGGKKHPTKATPGSIRRDGSDGKRRLSDAAEGRGAKRRASNASGEGGEGSDGDNDAFKKAMLASLLSRRPSGGFGGRDSSGGGAGGSPAVGSGGKLQRASSGGGSGMLRTQSSTATDEVLRKRAADAFKPGLQLAKRELEAQRAKEAAAKAEAAAAAPATAEAAANGRGQEDGGRENVKEEGQEGAAGETAAGAEQEAPVADPGAVAAEIEEELFQLCGEGVG